MEWDSIMVRYSEIAVKGRHTRSLMTSLLKKNITNALTRNGIGYELSSAPGRLFLVVPSVKLEDAINIVVRVFGVKSVSPVKMYELDGNITSVLRRAIRDFRHRIRGPRFRVRARRTGKHDFTSKDVEKIAGALILEEKPGLKVDLTSPDYTLWIEVREDKIYVYDQIRPGPGGLPLGSSGRSLVLYSGGFDSTVAAWYIMRRGSNVDLIYYDIGDEKHFEIAKQAAEFLYDKYVMGAYKMVLYRVWFHYIVEQLARSLEPAYSTLILRRLMLEHAARIALTRGYHALVTGESLAQVSSQTPESLYLIGSNLPVPVYRPLIGFDKDDVMKKSIELGLYDIVSRQQEFCAQKRRRPTPKPLPRVYEKELLKARTVLNGRLVRVPITENRLG